MINEDIAREILDELFSSLEALETRSAAILQFLKDKGIASEKELAVHFEQAGNASSVKWRAARLRIDHLLSSAIKAAAQEPPQSVQPKSSENKQEPPAKTTRKTTRKKDLEVSSKGEPEREIQSPEKVAASGKSEIKEEQQLDVSASNNRKENDRTGKSPEHTANSAGSEDPPSRKTA
jgi:hypothetical protein